MVNFNGRYGQKGPPPGTPGGVPNKNNGEWGHFTQVVWRDTTRIGCFMTDCWANWNGNRFLAKYTVCNYSPPGELKRSSVIACIWIYS